MKCERLGVMVKNFKSQKKFFQIETCHTGDLFKLVGPNDSSEELRHTPKSILHPQEKFKVKSRGHFFLPNPFKIYPFFFIMSIYHPHRLCIEFHFKNTLKESMSVSRPHEQLFGVSNDVFSSSYFLSKSLRTIS